MLLGVTSLCLFLKSSFERPRFFLIPPKRFELSAVMCVLVKHRGERRRSVRRAAAARPPHHLQSPGVPAELGGRRPSPLPRLRLQLLAGLPEGAAGQPQCRPPASRRLLQVPPPAWHISCVGPFELVSQTGISCNPGLNHMSKAGFPWKIPNLPQK